MLDLPFSGPILNAAGSLGFAPNKNLPFLGHIDGFFTNPISLRRRTPAHGLRFASYPGGLMVHTGHPNPGLSGAIRSYARKWQRYGKPLFVHLLGSHPDEYYSMVRRLEEVEGISGVELGMPPGADANLVHASVQAAIGELPVIVKIGLEQAIHLGIEVKEAGASGLSIGPPRGALVHDGQMLSGRLLGPGQFPRIVDSLRRMPAGLPVIVGVSLQTPEQIHDLLELGAVAVQLDTALWRLGPIVQGLSETDPTVP